MRARGIVAVAALVVATLASSVSQAALPVVIAGGILADGGFSTRHFGPFTTGCTASSVNPATTSVVSFTIFPASGEGRFAIANWCGVYESAFVPGRCVRVGQTRTWSCAQPVAGGGSSYAVLSESNGRPAVTSCTFAADPSSYWCATGFVTVRAD